MCTAQIAVYNASTKLMNRSIRGRSVISNRQIKRQMGTINSAGRIHFTKNPREISETIDCIKGFASKKPPV